MLNKITIGSSLKALQWAYQNKTKVIINKLLPPHPFDPLHAQNSWALLYYKLMMDGDIIGGDSVNAVKVEDEQAIVVCENNVINKIAYSEMYVFNDENTIGHPEIKQKVDEYTVIDAMSSVSFVFKDTRFHYNSEDKLVSEIHIQKECSRSPINIWTISHLTENDLQSFDFSDTMAKFKTESTLKESGFTGNSMKRDEIILDVDARDVQKKMHIYEETDKIKFIYE